MEKLQFFLSFLNKAQEDQSFKYNPENEAKQVQEETSVEYFYNLGDICPKATEKKVKAFASIKFQNFTWQQSLYAKGKH